MISNQRARKKSSSALIFHIEMVRMMSYLRSRDQCIGRLAQLVQSAALTRRRSLVRSQQRPRGSERRSRLHRDRGRRLSVFREIPTVFGRDSPPARRRAELCGRAGIPAASTTCFSRPSNKKPQRFCWGFLFLTVRYFRSFVPNSGTQDDD